MPMVIILMEITMGIITTTTLVKITIAIKIRMKFQTLRLP